MTRNGQDGFWSFLDVLRRAPRRWFTVLMLFAVAIATPNNGPERPLDAHECFVARSATEMLRKDDWILPRFNDLPRLQKPPLNYWAAIGAHQLAGGTPSEAVNEWEARAPSIVAALALLVFTYLLTRAWTGDTAVAWLAGAFVATSNGVLRWSHSAQPEMVYAAACSLAVFGFWRSRAALVAGRAKWTHAALGWLGVTLAVMSKGPLLPAFLLIGWIVGEFCETERVSLVRTLRPWLGLAIVLVGCLPWVAMIWWREPNAFEFWRSQMFDRTGGVESAWWRPFELFYVVAAAKMTAPWSLLALWALGWPWLASGRGLVGARILWGVCVIPLVALSFSATPKGYYMLPVFAPLAALAARGLLDVALAAQTSAFARRWWVRGVRAHAAMVLIAVVALAGLSLWAERAPFSLALACAALAVAAAYAVESWRGRFGALLLSIAALTVATATVGIEFSDRRQVEGALARHVGKLAPSARTLFVTGANSQVLIHYADRSIETIPSADLARRMKDVPGALVLLPAETWRHLGIAGRVLLEASDPSQAFVLAEASDGAPKRSAAQ